MRVGVVFRHLHAKLLGADTVLMTEKVAQEKLAALNKQLALDNQRLKVSRTPGFLFNNAGQRQQFIGAFQRCVALAGLPCCVQVRIHRPQRAFE